MQRPSKIKEVDFLRGFAMFAVIAIHSAVPDSPFQMVLRYIAVPLFVALSGFVLSRGYEPSQSVLTFYKKRLNVILLPYLIFSAVYIIQHGILHGWSTPSQIIFQFLAGEASIHLWFFRLIIELYILYPFIVGISRNSRLFCLLTLAVQVISYHTYQSVFLTFLMFLFYFVFGIYLGAHWQDPRGPRFMREGIFGEVFCAFGRYSYGIFLIHIIFLGTLFRILGDSFMSRCGIFIVTSIMSFISVWLIHRTPLSRILIGLNKKEK